MKWLLLDLSRAGDVDRQVDEVITTYETLQKNRKNSNAQQVNKAIQLLKRSIVDRVNEMEEFYHQNDLDPRSNRIEAARLKLKRLMKEVGFDASTVKSSPSLGPTGTPRATPIGKTIPASAAMATPPQQQQKPRIPTREEIEAGNEKITLKIQMTHDEFEELRVRREAMKQLLHRGEGKMAWENAYSHEQRANAKKEGMYSYGEVPFVAESNRLPERHQPQARRDSASNQQQRFESYGKYRAADPGRINDGQSKYISANSDLVSSTMRFSSPREAARGGAKSVGQKPFNPITPRTKTSTSTLKIFPLGTMK